MKMIHSQKYIFSIFYYMYQGGFPTLKTLIFIIWVFTVLRRYFLRLINGTSFFKTRLSLSFKLQSENTQRCTNKRQQFSNINPEYFSKIFSLNVCNREVEKSSVKCFHFSSKSFIMLELGKEASFTVV